MSRPTNADRAECAAQTLDHYGRIKEGRPDYDAPETMATDLIADLLHLIRAHGLKDPLRMLALAKLHFEAEKTDAPPSGKRRHKR
jgi:hypothetical protein